MRVSTRGGESCWCDLERGRSTDDDAALRNNRLISGSEFTDKSLNPELKALLLSLLTRTPLCVGWFKFSPLGAPLVVTERSAATMSLQLSSTGERPLRVLRRA